MARGTKLFQAPRSPLIQGRSRLRRPWWQPYGVAVAIGLIWPLVAFAASALAASGTEGRAGRLVTESGAAWFGCLPLLVPTVLLGGAAGMAVGSFLGVRRRWLVATIGALGCWYIVLALRAFAG